MKTLPLYLLNMKIVTTSTTNPAEERVAAMTRVASSCLVSSAFWVFDVVGSTKTRELIIKTSPKNLHYLKICNIYKVTRFCSINSRHFKKNLLLHVFLIKKQVFCLSLNFLNKMLEIRLRFS